MLLCCQHRSLLSQGALYIAPALLPVSTMMVRSLHQGKDDFEEDYETLGVASSVDTAGARDAFLRLAKQLHPDGGLQTADEAKFKRVETSYKRLLKKFSDERHNHSAVDGEYGLYYNQKKKHRDKTNNEEQAKEEQADGFYTLKHKIPQHRQYLSCEGMGVGTPAQREKQFATYKALRATENVVDFKVQQIQKEYPETGLLAMEKYAARKIKTRYGIERVVEDLILESMARGDFDNLPNAGKPLQFDNYNPYLDLATHKLNQVLLDNGYAPSWVQLERDIRGEKDRLRGTIRSKRTTLGRSPLPQQEQAVWDEFLSSLSVELRSLNKMIDEYNLVVPVLDKQMVHFPLARVAGNILLEGACKHHSDDHKK